MSVQPIPEGFHSVTPHLIIQNAAEAIEFYKKAFGAEEMTRMPTPDGKIMHAEIKIGDSHVMIAERMAEFGMKGPEDFGGSPVCLHIYCDNVDTMFETAVKAGGQVVMPPQDMFWGDRYGKLKDPFGHEWSIATHTADPSPEEMAKAAAEAFGG